MSTGRLVMQAKQLTLYDGNTRLAFTQVKPNEVTREHISKLKHLADVMGIKSVVLEGFNVAH